MLKQVLFANSRIASSTGLRLFSTTPPPTAPANKKSELKIQYENAEFGVNVSPKEFSAEEIMQTVDPKTMVKKEPSYEYRDLPKDGVEKNEYHPMHSLEEFPNTQNDISKEYGFKIKGLEPTRYNDWERKGRCTDF